VHAAGVAAHRGRRDIDDGPRPARRDERARHRLRAEKAALQVDAEHVVPLALRQFEECRAGEDTGVVDEDIGGAQGVHHRLDHALDARGLRHVALHGDGAAAEAANLPSYALRGRRIVEEVDADIGAVTREGHCDGATDSLLGARDERHLAFEPHASSSMLFPDNPRAVCVRVKAKSRT
jgi:hypothetical protein